MASITKLDEEEEKTKASVFLRTDPEVYHQVKMLATSQKRDMQDVMLEAMQDILRKYTTPETYKKNLKKKKS